jgi:hypothetical protein
MQGSGGMYVSMAGAVCSTIAAHYRDQHLHPTSSVQQVPQHFFQTRCTAYYHMSKARFLYITTPQRRIGVCGGIVGLRGTMGWLSSIVERGYRCEEGCGGEYR